MAPAPYPAEAAAHILADLRRRRYRVGSVDEAIRRGLLTDLEWCTVLDEFRERHGVREALSTAADPFPSLPGKRAV